MSENESLNTGVVLEEIKPEQYEKAALDFSEGNEHLRRLLLDCFNNGIKTRACSVAHDSDKKKQTPYVAFEFSEENMDAILKMINKLSEYNGVEMTFTKEPTVVSSFQINFTKEIEDECFDMIRQACMSQEEVQIEDIEEPMQRVIDIMGNHIIPNSYLQVIYDNQNGNREYSLAIRDEHYPEVIPPNEDEITSWTEQTVLIREADKKGYLEKVQTVTRNARYMRETTPNQDIITSIREGDEFKEKFSVNAAATMQGRTKNNNALHLEVEGGSSLDDIVGIIMTLHKAGQPVVTAFNTFRIDTRQYGDEQAILDAYNKEREKHQKAKRMLESGIEATEGSIRDEQIEAEARKIVDIQKSKTIQRETDQNVLE